MESKPDDAKAPDVGPSAAEQHAPHPYPTGNGGSNAHNADGGPAELWIKLGSVMPLDDGAMYNSIRAEDSDKLDSSPFELTLELAPAVWQAFENAASRVPTPRMEGSSASSRGGSGGERDVSEKLLMQVMTERSYVECVHHDGTQAKIYTDDLPHASPIGEIESHVVKVNRHTRRIVMSIQRNLPLSSSHMAGAKFRLAILFDVPGTSSPLVFFTEPFRVFAKMGRKGSRQKQIHMPTYAQLGSQRAQRLAQILAVARPLYPLLDEKMEEAVYLPDNVPPVINVASGDREVSGQAWSAEARALLASASGSGSASASGSGSGGGGSGSGGGGPPRSRFSTSGGGSGSEEDGFVVGLQPRLKSGEGHSSGAGSGESADTAQHHGRGTSRTGLVEGGDGIFARRGGGGERGGRGASDSDSTDGTGRGWGATHTTGNASSNARATGTTAYNTERESGSSGRGDQYSGRDGTHNNTGGGGGATNRMTAHTESRGLTGGESDTGEESDTSSRPEMGDLPNARSTGVGNSSGQSHPASNGTASAPASAGDIYPGTGGTNATNTQNATRAAAGASVGTGASGGGGGGGEHHPHGRFALIAKRRSLTRGPGGRFAPRVTEEGGSQDGSTTTTTATGAASSGSKRARERPVLALPEGMTEEMYLGTGGRMMTRSTASPNVDGSSSGWRGPDRLANDSDYIYYGQGGTSSKRRRANSISSMPSTAHGTGIGAGIVGGYGVGAPTASASGSGGPGGGTGRLNFGSYSGDIGGSVATTPPHGTSTPAQSMVYAHPGQGERNNGVLPPPLALPPQRSAIITSLLPYSSRPDSSPPTYEFGPFSSKYSEPPVASPQEQLISATGIPNTEWSDSQMLGPEVYGNGMARAESSGSFPDMPLPALHERSTSLGLVHASDMEGPMYHPDDRYNNMMHFGMPAVGIERNSHDLGSGSGTDTATLATATNSMPRSCPGGSQGMYSNNPFMEGSQHAHTSLNHGMLPALPHKAPAQHPLGGGY